MRIRIPQIIHQTKDSIPNLTEAGRLAYTQLADEIREDREVANMLQMDEDLDVLFYSQFQRATLQKQTWHSIPWWFAENYEFLCLNSIQQSTKSNQPSDPFFYLKQKALETAMTIFPALVKPLLVETRQSSQLTKDLFTKALLRILWGNKADLSMSGGKVNKAEIKNETANYLLIDEIDTIWSHFQAKQFSRVIVCADNTGLEILCDFALIAVLLFFNPALSIQYTIKEKPVFVSDVTLADIQPTIAALESSGDEGMD